MFQDLVINCESLVEFPCASLPPHFSITSKEHIRNVPRMWRRDDETARDDANPTDNRWEVKSKLL